MLRVADGAFDGVHFGELVGDELLSFHVIDTNIATYVFVVSEDDG